MLSGNVSLPGAGRSEEDEISGFGFHKFVQGSGCLGGEEQGADRLRQIFVIKWFDRVFFEFG